MDVKKAKKIPAKRVYLTVAGTGLPEFDGSYLWHVPAHKENVSSRGKAPMTRRPCFVNEAIDRIVIEQHWTGNWKILKRPKLIAGGGNRNELDGDFGAFCCCGISGTMPPVAGWEVVVPTGHAAAPAPTMTYRSAELQAKMESQYRRAKQMALSGKADAAARKHNVGLDNLKASFAKLDTNNDGFISREELTKVLCTLGPVPLGKDEAVQLFNLADTNGDGVIDHEELAALLGSGISNDRGWSARVMYAEQEAERVARAKAANVARGRVWVAGSRSGEWSFCRIPAHGTARTVSQPPPSPTGMPTLGQPTGQTVTETKVTLLPSVSTKLKPRINPRLKKKTRTAKERDGVVCGALPQRVPQLPPI